MRLLTCVLVVLLVVVGTVSAAAPVHTAKGDKAMIFGFQGLNDLGLDGPLGSWSVGMRYYISHGNALRAVLSYGSDSWTDKGLEEGEDDYEFKESEMGIGLAYEKHLEAPCASVSPYLGGGVHYYKWSEEGPIAIGRDYPVETEDESGFYVFGMAGFEWGFTECMTLGGEYQLGFSSGSYSDEVEYGGDSTTLDEEDYSWMGFSTASVFLSVYW